MSAIRYDLSGRRVWIAGHTGMVGSAVLRRLQNGLVAEILIATRAELNLTDQTAVRNWMETNRPDTVILCAARVGGIQANSLYPVDFLYDNLMIASNVIHAAHSCDVDKLLFLGSSCIYPKFAPQPIPEDALLSGPLEPTNEAYAIAKIAGLKLCEAYRRQHGRDFISVMPCNLYGPGDNFSLENSHVVPALIRKAHAAKIAGETGLDIWGSGNPKREFLHVDDCADGLVHILQHYSDDEHVNLGAPEDVTIAELAQIILSVVGVEGSVRTNPDKPDGTPRKKMDTRKLESLGWSPGIGLRDGLARTYRWFLEHENHLRET